MIEILKSSSPLGELKILKRPAKGCWIHITAPEKEELAKLKHFLVIPPEVSSSVNDLDEMPNIEKLDDGVFILIRTPQRNPLGSELEFATIPLGILITTNYIVTLCSGENDIIKKVRQKKIDTDNRAQTALKILVSSGKTYSSYLNLINKKIHGIQDSFKRSMRNEDIFEMLNIEKTLVYFDTSLKGNQFVIDRLGKTALFTTTEGNLELLDDAKEENKQATEMTVIYASIIVGMTETFASVISNNLNSVMKLLTSITLVMMLPTLVASIYGMNVKLPFQNSPHAFAITMGLALVLSVIGVYALWKGRMF